MAVSTFKAKLIVNCNNKLGECPIWNDRTNELCWIDNLGKKFWKYNPTNKQLKSYNLPECPGSFCLCNNNSILFAFENGPAFYDINTNTMHKRIFHFEPNKKTKMNDGRADRNGRFIVGGMRKYKSKDLTAIYRINHDLSYQKLIDDIKCTNSICFSLDGQSMYMTDTFGYYKNPRIMKYEYTSDYRMPFNPIVYTKHCQAPDGSCIDSDGYLWSAQCGKGKIIRYDKYGNVNMIVEVPEYYVTCCAFGGENLDTLYVTTLDPTDMYPDPSRKATPTIGGLYAVHLPIKGVKENRFGSTFCKL
eukprot:288857_1